MPDHHFAPDDHPFTNRDALQPHYTPDEMVGRDEELDAYHNALQPAINDDQPDNLFLYGKTGVGKTAATKYMLERLEESSEQYDVVIHTHRINCDEHDTTYKVSVRLVNAFREERIAESGHPQSKIYRLLWETLDNLGGIFILVLDEIDHLRDEGILYQLSRAMENDNLQNTRISIIGISNDLTFREELSPKVRSSLTERRLNFSAYDANELTEVLMQRRDVAFADGVIGEGEVRLCAAYGSQAGGDARHALDVMMYAGDIVDATGDEEITEEHVRRGKEKLEEDRVHEGIRGLSQHEQLLLACVTASPSEKIRFSRLFERYERECERNGMDSQSIKTVHDQLDQAEMLGIVELDIRQDDGRYKTIELAVDQGPASEVLAEALSEDGVVVGEQQSVEQY